MIHFPGAQGRQQNYWSRLRWQLSMLFFPLAGPFLAPLFSRIGIWPFGMIGRFIYVRVICSVLYRNVRSSLQAIRQLSARSVLVLFLV